jgi:hypothetical protein
MQVVSLPGHLSEPHLLHIQVLVYDSPRWIRKDDRNARALQYGNSDAESLWGPHSAGDR